MITAEVANGKHSKSVLEKFIFNCEAYRLDGSTWVRLEKVFIDNQFDCKGEGISKVKVKGERGHENTFMVKVTFNHKDYYYSMAQELQLHWLLHVVTTKAADTLPASPADDYINVCAGSIYKKSGFLGEWEKCFVMITREGLTAARDEKSKPDLQIAEAKEIWTRF
jgi:hypothetical protein